jgi:hypothetical protein
MVFIPRLVGDGPCRRSKEWPSCRSCQGVVPDRIHAATTPPGGVPQHGIATRWERYSLAGAHFRAVSVRSDIRRLWPVIARAILFLVSRPLPNSASVLMYRPLSRG